MAWRGPFHRVKQMLCRAEHGQTEMVSMGQIRPVDTVLGHYQQAVDAIRHGWP